VTYSIVARDPDTGDFGVAVQSHYLSVGGVCPWARAGVLALAFAVHDGWAELLRRLPAAGLFPDDPALLDALLAPAS
jgi:hypothetical protein